jgi:hypothetical protein
MSSSLDKRLRGSLDPKLGGKAPQHTRATSNGVNTASQQGREPVNGVTGAGTAGEPYDQGNSDGD